MAYTAFIWPPLIFPLPKNIGQGNYATVVQGAKPPLALPVAVALGKIGGTFAIGARPPMNLPLPLAARTSKVAVAAAPTMPSMVAPSAPASKVTYTPAASAVAAQNPAKVVDPYTTRAAINSFFGIVSPQPGSGK